MTRLDKIDKVNAASQLVDIWDVLDDKERTVLVENCWVERFKKSEGIYQEGDQPDHLLCLLSGKVKIYRNGVGGRSLINRVLVLYNILVIVHRWLVRLMLQRHRLSRRV